MTGQRLNDFRRLPVIKHVHDIGVAEGVRRHRNGKVHPVIVRPLHGGLQPVPHGLVGDGPEGLTASGAFRGEPAADLVHVAGVRQRHQPHRVFGRAAAPAPDLLRQDPDERPRPVQLKGFRRQRTGLADARTGVPERAEQKVVPAIGHVVKERAHLRREQVKRRHAVGGGHAPQRHGGRKIGTRREVKRGDAFW